MNAIGGYVADSGRRSSRSPYRGPSQHVPHSLRQLLEQTGRAGITQRQMAMLRPAETGEGGPDVPVYYAGEIAILERPCVSIVGTREVSQAGWCRADRLARELAATQVVVVSGLAKGVDTAALTGAMNAGGKVAAVIGTPLSRAYPAENASLQETIWRDHLLLTPFAEGERVFRANFPKRNRVMAAISDATVIVEASDTSGTLHQAAECQRLGRWLFIMRSVVDDASLKWPKSFLGKPKTEVLSNTTELVAALQS